MAEAFAVLGLAANIFQFIEYGIKLSNETRKIYISATGTSSALGDYHTVTKNLKDLALRLKSDHCTTAQSDHDILDLAESCHNEAAKFISLLNDLKRNGKHRKWESLLQAQKTLRKKDQIEEIQRNLNTYRSQLTLQLLRTLSLRHDEQSSVLQDVHKLMHVSSALNINTAGQIEQLRSKIDELKITAGRSSEVSSPILEKSLRSITELGRHVELEQSVCESLRYDTMTIRMSSIAEAHMETFDWMFDTRGNTQFVHWLQSEGGIYYVSGKPGSGKSTLMKYLCNHTGTLAALQQWSNNKILLTGNHFFWIAGTEMQKSQEGLMRTLLYDVLRQCPSLTKDIVPSRWNDAMKHGHFIAEMKRPWARKELVDGLTRVSQLDESPVKICFFIDGLDEYDGDHEELVKAVLKLTRSPNIKICLSSRPWNVFEDSFGSLTRKIRLQDLTRNDIKCYVEDELQKNQQFAKLMNRDPNSQDLVDEIANKADGVFLWVVLVVRSLKEGMRNADTISILRKRLKKLPTDLEKFFRHILNQVEDVYWEGTTQAFEMALAADAPLSLHAFAVLDEEDPDYAITGTVPKLSHAESGGTMKDLERRLHARCKGLLEPSSRVYDGSLFGGKTVHFLHRTVRDFLRVKDIHNLLLERLEKPFDANEAICKGLLIYLRSFPTLDYSIVDEILEDIAFYAWKIEKNSGRSPVLILDTCERYTPTFWPKSGGEYPVHPMIISRGLHLYLKRKLDEDPDMLVRCRPKCNHMLNTALLWSSTMLKEYQRAPPNPEMIRLLLDHGFDPLDYISGLPSPWSEIVCHLRKEHENISIDDKQIWCQVLTLILEKCSSSGSKDDRRLRDCLGMSTHARWIDEIFSEDQAIALKALLPQPELSVCTKRKVDAENWDYLRRTQRQRLQDEK